MAYIVNEHGIMRNEHQRSRGMGRNQRSEFGRDGDWPDEETLERRHGLEGEAEAHLQ